MPGLSQSNIEALQEASSETKARWKEQEKREEEAHERNNRLISIVITEEDIKNYNNGK